MYIRSGNEEGDNKRKYSIEGLIVFVCCGLFMNMLQFRLL